MKTVTLVALVLGLLMEPAKAHEKGKAETNSTETKKEKTRPPRIPDAPFVPKRGMFKREKGQFWAGPPDEGRFAQILTLTLVPKDKLQEKLAEWPNYQELSAEQRERLVERIDEVRGIARKQALEVAKEFDLRVEPGKEDDFVRMYWKERVAMDQALKEEFQEKRKKLEEDSEKRILRQFPKVGSQP